MSKPTGRAFAKALEDAGVVTDLNTVQRIVIDIDIDLARVYVQRIGDDKLLDAFKGQLGLMLAEAAQSAPAGVRYWTAISRDLLRDDLFRKTLTEAGLRLVEHGPWQSADMQLFLVEDAGAPAELEGRTVELTFAREGDGPVIVAQRDVVT